MEFQFNVVVGNLLGISFDFQSNTRVDYTLTRLNSHNSNMSHTRHTRTYELRRKKEGLQCCSGATITSTAHMKTYANTHSHVQFCLSLFICINIQIPTVEN